MPSVINNRAASSIGSSQPISLQTLFQIVTCCCIFFAVLRISPLTALIMTLILAPSLIRTAYVNEVLRRNNQELNWQQKLLKFAESIVAVVFTLIASALVFSVISLGFGLLGILLGWAASSSDFWFEAGIIGTVGGMIWGIAGGFLTMVYFFMRFWNPAALVR